MRNLFISYFAVVSIMSSAPVLADLGDQLFKLLPNDGAANDFFGLSVAISGSTGIGGSFSDNDNGSESGSAYLFDVSTGLQIAKLLPDDGAADDFFGWSVGIGGTPGKQIAIVGSLGDDDNGSTSGAAYLFDAVTGIQLAKLLPNDGEADDRFGRSVAISGTTAIISAWLDNDNGINSGSAYLFDISNPVNPVQIAKLLASDGAAEDHFGHLVAICGTIAIVGAPGDDDNGSRSGSAYLFDATTGAQLAKLLPDDGAEDDIFGAHVAISANIAIAGAAGDDDNGDSSGSAYLFDTKTGAQIVKLLPDDGAAEDGFGGPVAISGTAGNEVVIIAAVANDDNGDNSGSAYLFNATTCRQIAILLPTDGAAGDLFGRAVGISGPTGSEVVIIGAMHDDDNGSSSGSAYLFDATSAPGTCPWDLDANAVVGVSDLLSLLASWGPCECCAADFDGNKTISVSDLLDLLANWGPCL